MPDPKLTPLNEFHRKHGARLVQFAGWEMPVQYTSIIEEHLAVRKKAGLFDVSHMGEISVKGADSQDFLNFLMTNDIAVLKDGHALYTLMCYPDGGVVDDLLVYRLAKDEFLLCVNASNTEADFNWLNDHSKGFDCIVEDVSLLYGQLALQGPIAEQILSKLINYIGRLKRFEFSKESIHGIDLIVSRTGYTGEDGFELYCPWDATEAIAELILENGKDQGLLLAGLGARDSLRLEAGYPLYGHEISSSISPLEAHLDFAVKLGKQSDFIGKSALLKQKESGLKSEIVFFKLNDRRIARQGAEVFQGPTQVGKVVSGAFSPSLNQPIGSAYIRFLPKPSDLQVDIRGNRIPLLIIELPFI